MNEVAMVETKEKTISLQEIAEKINVSYETVKRHARKLGFTQDGVKTYLSLGQVTELLESIKKSNNNQFNLIQELSQVSTKLTPALKIKRAMELMQEGYEEELQVLREQVAELAPKADFADAVTGSKDCIEMKEVAKILNIPGVGRNKLFEILRNKGILDRNNQPYQYYVDCGYFRIVETKYSVNGEIRIGLKTVVFQRGLAFIHKLLEKELAA